MTDEEYRILSLMLARHVDDLQGVAAAWGGRLVGMLSETHGDAALLAEEYFRNLPGRGALSHAAMTRRRALREGIYSARMAGMERAAAYLQERLAELVRSENEFCERWIIAMSGLSHGMTEEEVRARYRPRMLDDAQMEAVRKYGTYNGGTVDAILQKVLDSDVDRIMAAVDNAINISRAREGRTAWEDGVIHLVGKAALTTSRQIMVNVAMIVNGVSNNVSIEVSRLNPALAGLVMWVTEMDERVCEDCDPLEGMTFRPGEAPACPLHPNCRCHLVGVTAEIAAEAKERRNA